MDFARTGVEVDLSGCVFFTHLGGTLTTTSMSSSPGHVQARVMFSDTKYDAYFVVGLGFDIVYQALYSCYPALVLEHTSGAELSLLKYLVCERYGMEADSQPQRC